ncbi:Uncharacterised protein [Mycobacteroides abscessus subsp. bolletii]|nr:Uncharacterised protein [Mycobacteroides abscessus subsp. bolletii]SIH15546.1 Uncharacterised protein [Mycobacteroides abscessus subsp. abscessus]SIH52277.1 Uncharacterised protein [Mycobacteroides abscessus subsp. abscessus]SII19010.1 Uncharacterised protein [Mycobacteroides abscessus subsp. abscessus]SII97304.1 Uncharacterised protein [Mycobacteroides abscessus subsp. abscessus]
MTRATASAINLNVDMSDEKSVPESADEQDTPQLDDDFVAEPAKKARGLTLSLRWDVLVVSALLVLSLAGNALLGWCWFRSARSEQRAESAVAALQEDIDSRHHAEQVALDYAKGAADMNYKDIPGWTKRLTADTSPELTKKLKEAAAAMEQIIVPLQWVSTPTPIAAVTRSAHDGVYVVNCFVSVTTKNAQAPDGIMSTATYTVTVNKNDSWVITDVGGVDSAMKAGK